MLHAQHRNMRVLLLLLLQNQVMLLFLMLALSSLVHSAPLINTSLPLDCEDVYQIRVMKNASAPSGVYTIYPAGSKPLKVYCDMGCVNSNGHNDGRWTVSVNMNLFKAD